MEEEPLQGAFDPVERIGLNPRSRRKPLEGAENSRVGLRNPGVNAWAGEKWNLAAFTA
jgi:hypothetical protein